MHVRESQRHPVDWHALRVARRQNGLLNFKTMTIEEARELLWLANDVARNGAIEKTEDDWRLIDRARDAARDRIYGLGEQLNS